MRKTSTSIGFALLLSLTIVSAASLSGRLYNDHREARIAQAAVLSTEEVVCVK